MMAKLINPQTDLEKHMVRIGIIDVEFIAHVWSAGTQFARVKDPEVGVTYLVRPGSLTIEGGQNPLSGRG